MTDLSQTPTEVLERARERAQELIRLFEPFRRITGLQAALDEINAELSRRQKDD